jgi:hypothetical protein
MIDTRLPAGRFHGPAIALALTCALFAGLAVAQDPAVINSGRYDPANLDHRKSAPPRAAGRPAMDPNNPMLRALGLTPALTPEQIAPKNSAAQPNIRDEINKVQQMMDNAYNASYSSSQYSNPYDSQLRYERMMEQTDALVGRNWDSLSSSTQNMYREIQRLDAEQRERQSALGSQYFGSADVAMGVGQEQAREGMRRISDALMPVLRDLKNAADAELRNAANGP